MVSFRNVSIFQWFYSQFCNSWFSRLFTVIWFFTSICPIRTTYWIIWYKWMSRNCHAKWSLQSKTSVTWNLQPFHGFSVGGFKHRHHKARNHCACHAKRIVSEPLQIHHACQRFCNPHELLRLPRILQCVEITAPATRNTVWRSKNVPSTRCFNDFDFQIVLARRRGANFGDFNFQKCSEPLSF